MAKRGKLIGREVAGGYRVIRAIGAGGGGAVYEVEHAASGERRAMKVLHARDAMSPRAATRLVREAGVAQRVGSHHVVRTFDVGQLEDGRPFVLMELLEGRTWRELLSEEGALHPTQATRLAIQVCEGLAAAHGEGIIHRDLKPDNLFLVGAPGRERVKILDFGIGKHLRESARGAAPLTETGAILGTPHYLSPEQAQGRRDIDGRADQYALGVTLWESLAGRKPFGEHADLAELLVRIDTGARERLSGAAPHLPPGLAEVVERAMSLERTDRYPSVVELARALRPFAAREVDAGAATGALPAVIPRTVPPPPEPPPAPAPDYEPIPDTPPSRASSPAGVPSRAPVAPARSRGVWALLAVLLALAGIGGAVTLAFGPPARRTGPARTTPPPPAPGTDPAGADAGPASAPSPRPSPVATATATSPGDATLVAELERLYYDRSYARCLRRSERAEPTPPVMTWRMTCAVATQCYGTYRRGCAWLAAYAPSSPVLHHNCPVVLPTLPARERGSLCPYRDPAAFPDR